MKIWIKYILGILLGIGAAFILPSKNPEVASLLAAASEFAIRFGRYTLLPVLFFGVFMAVFKLRDTKMLIKTALWTGGTILGSTLILTLLGLLSILLVKLPKINIPLATVNNAESIGFRSLVMQILPHSGFEAVINGSFLLPCFIFAGFAGAGCKTDENASKPVITFFESAAKLCYSVMSFFIDWLSVGMIAISAYWTTNARTVLASGSFLPLFIMLLVDFVIVFGIIYPLIIYFLCNDSHPYHVMYACITPILAAFFSADSNLSLLVNLRHTRESLGAHAESADVTIPVFSIFGRGGSALVTAVCFVVILRSYNGNLAVTPFAVFWTFIMSFAVSLCLGAIPAGGTLVSLTVLCTLYARGFDAGWLLLKNAAPVFCSFAAVFDAVSAVFGSYIVAVKTKQFEHVEVRHYI